MIYEVRLGSDGFPFSVMVEAEGLTEAIEMAKAEFPKHNVTGVYEKSDVAMLIK